MESKIFFFLLPVRKLEKHFGAKKTIEKKFNLPMLTVLFTLLDEDKTKMKIKIKNFFSFFHSSLNYIGQQGCDK
jgi:hypothetical protein